MTRLTLRFGLTLKPEPFRLRCATPISVGPGKLILITGPSGSGKSTILAEIERQCPTSVWVNRLAFPRSRAIVDAIAPRGTLYQAVGLLTSCGLGEPRLWLRALDELSEGERFRARLARAVAQHVMHRNVGPLLCDEFGSNLHRRLGHAMAFGLRKLTDAHGLCAVVACHDDDMADDLNPDAVVCLGGSTAPTVRLCIKKPGTEFSLRRRLSIEIGSKKDYEAFSGMHYKRADALGFVHKVFLLREGRGGQPLGIVVYAHGPLELSLRNLATGGLFVRRPQWLNRNLRILRRLVIHPDVRGCGLGHYLVRRTLSSVGTPYVECLASMGAINPVFEKAGMRRIGQITPSPLRLAAVRALKRMGVDPSVADLAHELATRHAVRSIVERVVRRWYAATGIDLNHRAHRQAPAMLAQTFQAIIGSEPVYYLWHRDARLTAAFTTSANRNRRAGSARTSATRCDKAEAPASSAEERSFNRKVISNEKRFDLYENPSTIGVAQGARGAGDGRGRPGHRVRDGCKRGGRVDDRECRRGANLGHRPRGCGA